MIPSDRDLTDEEVTEYLNQSAALRRRQGHPEGDTGTADSPGLTEMGGDPCPLCGESVLSLPGHLPECDGK